MRSNQRGKRYDVSGSDREMHHTRDSKVQSEHANLQDIGGRSEMRSGFLSGR